MLDTSVESRDMHAPTLRFRSFLLATSWLDCWLLSIEWIVFYVYFIKQKRRGKRRNHALAAIFVVLVDLLGTVGTSGLTWTHVLRPDRPDIRDYRHIFMPMMLLSTNIAAAIEQLFLTFRIHRLNRSTLLASALTFAVLVHFCLTTTCGFYLTVYGKPMFHFISDRTLITGGLISALVDLVIPSIFYWELHRIAHSFNESTSRARGLVRNLTVKAFSGGAIVAVFGVLAVVLFTTGNVGAFLFFWGSLGRLYGISTLINLIGFQSVGTNDSSWDLTRPRQIHKTRASQLASARTTAKRPPSCVSSDLPSHFTEITTSSDAQRVGACRHYGDFVTPFSELSKTSSIAFSPRRRANSLFASPSTSLGYPPESFSSQSGPSFASRYD